jgi:drug/metabolite transporter (DMT)-like permease
MYVVSGYILNETGAMKSFTLLTLRLVIGIMVLMPIAAARSELRFRREQIKSLLLVGFVGYGVSLSLQFLGTQFSGGANGALITSASPAFIVLFAFLILRESLNLPRVLAILLATVGVVIVVFDPSQVNLGSDRVWGNLALLGAAVTWGLYSVLVKWSGAKGLSTLAITVMVLVGGLPVAIPFSIWEIAAAPIDPMKIDLVIIGGVLYLGIISTALAMFLWNKSFELLDASVASLMFFAQPVVGVALSAWLLRDPLGVNFFIGGAMILLGVLLASLPKRA